MYKRHEHRFTEHVASLAGIGVPEAFKRHRSREKGERLLTLLHDVQTPGLEGDREVTDAWANELGLQGWYEWVHYLEPI